LLTIVAFGCAKKSDPNLLIHPTTLPATYPSDLTPLSRNEDVDALVAVPVGWKRDPLKSTANHAHQVWISPSGRTAYGVIRFSLPLPVPAEYVVRPFLSQMRRTEGEATLITRQNDPTLPGVRFVAEGGRYTVRTNLMSRGWRGWAIYAGTLRNEPIDEKELESAERARETTQAGLPATP